MYSVNFNFLATKSDNSKSIKDNPFAYFLKDNLYLCIKDTKIGEKSIFCEK